jgi:hypothetical protein
MCNQRAATKLRNSTAVDNLSHIDNQQSPLSYGAPGLSQVARRGGSPTVMTRRAQRWELLTRPTVNYMR